MFQDLSRDDRIRDLVIQRQSPVRVDVDHRFRIARNVSGYIVEMLREQVPVRDICAAIVEDRLP